MTDFADSDIMNTVVRMVVPMRREFGSKLDVQQFMRDRDYARQVLDQALASQDTRLRDYAQYVSERLLSARIAAKPKPAAPAAAGAAAAAPAAPAETPSEKALRDRVLRKYTSGLR